MKTITMQKSELKALIQSTIKQSIHQEFEKINDPYVPSEEMAEIEQQHNSNPKKDIEYIRL